MVWSPAQQGQMLICSRRPCIVPCYNHLSTSRGPTNHHLSRGPLNQGSPWHSWKSRTHPFTSDPVKFMEGEGIAYLATFCLYILTFLRIPFPQHRLPSVPFLIRRIIFRKLNAPLRALQGWHIAQSADGALQRLTYGSVKSGQTPSHANVGDSTKRKFLHATFSLWDTF